MTSLHVLDIVAEDWGLNSPTYKLVKCLLLEVGHEEAINAGMIKHLCGGRDLCIKDICKSLLYLSSERVGLFNMLFIDCSDGESIEVCPQDVRSYLESGQPPLDESSISICYKPTNKFLVDQQSKRMKNVK